jgi:hypothetical protein
MRIHFKKLTCVGFEEFCFELLRRVGFSNLDWRKGTPKDSSPADSGRDIVAHQQREDVDGSRFSDVWFVDCKHYSKAVPPTELQNALAWAEAESPDVLLFIASGYFSNPAKDYLAKYKQSRKPRFRIKAWELPQIEHLTSGRRSLAATTKFEVLTKTAARDLRQLHEHIALLEGQEKAENVTGVPASALKKIRDVDTAMEIGTKWLGRAIQFAPWVIHILKGSGM